MQIQVRRGGFGPMGGGVVVLGIAAGLLSVLVPGFWPIAVVSLVLGIGFAAILGWRRRSDRHPTISGHALGADDGNPVETGVADPAFREDLRRRVADGITPEMAGASRGRFAILQGTILLALVLDVAFALPERAASARSIFSMAAMAVVVGATVWRYGRFSPRAGHAVSEDELAALAARSYRCARCQAVVLPEEEECPQCGSLRQPRRALAFGIVFGISMTMLALWRAGLLEQVSQPSSREELRLPR